jgi:hypothetical protein
MEPIPFTLKRREFSAGFFGWFLFSNLILLAFGLIAGGYNAIFHYKYNFGTYIFVSSFVCIWLSTIIVPAVLFAKKRFWRGMGIVAAVILNTGTGFLLLQLVKIPVREFWEIVLVPIPSNFLLLIFALNIN